MVDSTTAFDQSTLGCSFHCTSAGGIANVLPPAPCAPTGETAAMGVIAVASASTAAMMRLFQAPVKHCIRYFVSPTRHSVNLPLNLRPEVPSRPLRFKSFSNFKL